MKSKTISVDIPVYECNYGIYCNYYDAEGNGNVKAPDCRFLRTIYCGMGNRPEYRCILYDCPLRTVEANEETGGDTMVYRLHKCKFTYNHI
jgi:hypothetical protein